MKGDVNLRYIGAKTNLLPQIEELLNKYANGNEQTFLDLFAGTNVVGSYFKRDYTIYSNDLLYFSHVYAKATIENNDNLDFSELKKHGIENPLQWLQSQAENSLTNSKTGYYEKAYTPVGNAMYFSKQNGKRIDFIRDTIDEWRMKRWINEKEYFYLIAVLIESLPYVSNITGTYGAFLKHWDKRATKPLELLPLRVENNYRNNRSFHEDANDLGKKIKADIVYIDTPYNSRQYASNYHVLENIARNNKPELNGVTKIFDWKPLRSNYAMKRKALCAMKDLIENINCTHIILSYNNEGIIPEKELIELLKSYAVNDKFEIQKIPYRKYKSKKPSKTEGLHELLIYIQRKPTEQKQNILKRKTPPTTRKMKEEKYIKSPLNYIGGKYKLLHQILPLFPSEIETFVDLFSGGANVGINVEARQHIFNDMNYRINEMFRYFKEQEIEELISKIKYRITEFQLSKTNENGYLRFRKQYNEQPNPLDLYVLVSYSYNYQFRFNNNMEFNNPFGRNRSQFSENMENNLRRFMEKLSTMQVTFSDDFFTEFDFSSLKAGDFIYLDPPYLITTGSYNNGNRGFLDWGERQEKQMYQVMKRLSEKNIHYALSNVLEHKGEENLLLKEFIVSENVRVHFLDYNYDNSSHNSKKKGSQEILLTNY